MFYTEFDDLLPEPFRSVDLFPQDLQAEIEATNDWTYNDINNGVYKSGFAQYVPQSCPKNLPIETTNINRQEPKNHTKLP